MWFVVQIIALLAGVVVVIAALVSSRRGDAVGRPRTRPVIAGWFACVAVYSGAVAADVHDASRVGMVVCAVLSIGVFVAALRRNRRLDRSAP